MKTQIQRELLRVPMSREDLMKMRLYLMKNDIFFTAGSYTISCASLRVKFLLAEKIRAWRDIDGNVVFMTPAEIARTELDREYAHIKRVGWQSKHIELFDKGVPLLYTGQFEGNAVYVDLKAAYHSIYKRLPINVLYPRGWPKNPMMLDGVAARLADDKAARNAVIGTIRSRSITGYKGSKVIKLSAKNRYLSPCLWGTIMDYLNDLASVAYTLGAIYINTDGYIFPLDTGWAAFIDLLKYYQHDFKAIPGYCHVSGWNSYKIYDKQTKTYRHDNNEGRPFSTIYQNERSTVAWLKYMQEINM